MYPQLQRNGHTETGGYHDSLYPAGGDGLTVAGGRRVEDVFHRELGEAGFQGRLEFEPQS